MASGQPGALPPSRASRPHPAISTNCLPRGSFSENSILKSDVWQKHVAALRENELQYEGYRESLSRQEAAMKPVDDYVSKLLRPAQKVGYVDTEGRCEAQGSEVVRADSGTFECDGWVLAAGEKAEVRFVHPSGNSVLRNPSGRLSRSLPPDGWVLLSGVPYHPVRATTVEELRRSAQQLLSQCFSEDVSIPVWPANTSATPSFADSRDVNSFVQIRRFPPAASSHPQPADGELLLCDGGDDPLGVVTAVDFDGIDVLTATVRAAAGKRAVAVQVPECKLLPVLGALRALCASAGCKNTLPEALRGKHAALAPGQRLSGRLREVAAEGADLLELAESLEDRCVAASTLHDKFPRRDDGGVDLCGGGHLRWCGDAASGQLLLCDRNRIVHGFGAGEHVFVEVSGGGDVLIDGVTAVAGAAAAAERGKFGPDDAEECVICDERILKSACRRVRGLLRCVAADHTADLMQQDSLRPVGTRSLPVGAGVHSGGCYGRRLWRGSPAAAMWCDLMRWIGAPPAAQALLQYA